MNINVIGVPTFYGCDKLGPQLGPDKLKEKEFIQNTNMNMYSPEDLASKGLDSIVIDILSSLHSKKIEAIHVSFDLDFIDSQYVPGTGTRFENGFTVDESKHLLIKLLESGLVKSMDLVELNPSLDKDDITADKLST